MFLSHRFLFSWVFSPTIYIKKLILKVLFFFFFDKAPRIGPNLTSLTPINSTALNATWEALSLDDANGVIVNYTVCYTTNGNELNSCSTSRTTNNSTLSYTLTGLNEATTYVVAVKASTKIGDGPLGKNLTNKTDEASTYYNPF